MLRRVFMAGTAAIVILAALASFFSARSIDRPIAGVMERLREAEATGMLPEFTASPGGIREIFQLTESFNRAAASVREARENLQGAYVEFVGSLANALDARDRYTAGHSQRVSSLSQAIAIAMQLDRAAVDRIQIGALLHDLGKIGIADALLQKQGALTLDEFAVIRLHPGIGRKILQGVHGFAPYLDAVELHHENWDGSGYPHGQSGEETSIDARIIHVADAYDAMTSDRPYRHGMPHEVAIEIILNAAGTQFDPKIAAVFASLPIHRTSEHTSEKGLLTC